MISQTALDHFRTSLGGKKDDPYSVLLRRNKLPMALLDDAANPNARKVRPCWCGCDWYELNVLQRTHIVETEPFADTFGPKSQRKRPRIEVGTFEELSKAADGAIEEREEARGTTSIGALSIICISAFKSLLSI